MRDIKYKMEDEKRFKRHGDEFLHDPSTADISGMYFGTETARYENKLKDYIANELQDSEYYRILAKRASDEKKKQIIMNISSDEMNHARRMAAAYFLATGNNYSPNVGFIKSRIPPFKLALRERFKEEYAAAAKYQKMAEETSDISLQELLNSIITDEKRHAIELQHMIEESIIK